MTKLARRQFILVSALAAGFAGCARPIASQVVATDSDGLEAGEVKILVPGGEIPAYRAMPATGTGFPVVLVVQEIFGVHEHIQDVCRRFAKLGYLAIAPELFARQGDVSQLESIDEIRQIVNRVPDEQVMADLDDTIAWAESTGKADIQRLGITGFCWGGRIVWLYAAHNPDLKAGVAWYGRLVGDKTELTPQQPVDVAADLRAPVLGLYGGQDRNIPLETVEQMRAELAKGDSGSEIVVYPDAPHGFHADYRDSYRPDAAQDAWQRLQDWFAAQGVAP